jgi:hypothetical protein
MLGDAGETTTSKPFQIKALEEGAPRPPTAVGTATPPPASRPTVDRHDPRYFDVRWFATPDPGQHWVHARQEQIAAIEAQTARPRCRSRRSASRRAPDGQFENLKQAFPSLIPSKPYCADALDAGLVIRSTAHALRRRHVQINGPSTFTWMPHDVDRRDAYFAHEDGNLPPPNVIIINPRNGHAHCAYLLTTPIARHSAARLAPLSFYAAVERGIARRLGADRCYTGLIVKNPLHAAWKVEWRREQPYALTELADALFPEDTRSDSTVQTTFGAGRNVTVFDELRTIAYREVRKFKRGDAGAAGLAAFRDRLEAIALGINRQFPQALPLSEVRAIAKSVAKWTWARFTPQRFSQIQAHRARARTRRNLAIVKEIKNASS